MNPKTNILIIGGTGMLKAASTYFIQNDCQTIVVGRNQQRLNDLLIENPKHKDNIALIQTDYTNNNFLDKIQINTKHLGKIDKAILWIHNSGTETGMLLKKWLIEQNPAVLIYELKGSASYNPKTLSDTNISLNKQNELDTNFRSIYLGFQIENGYSRWLSHAEISAGTVEAVNNDWLNSTIGVTEPWEKKP